MTHKNPIIVCVGVKCYDAFMEEAEKHSYFGASLFRQFLMDLADKYDQPKVGIFPPTQRQTEPKKKEGRKSLHHVGAMFLDKAPVDMVDFCRRKYNGENKDEKRLDKFKFLRVELMEWLNKKGYNLTSEDMMPDYKNKTLNHGTNPNQKSRRRTKP